MTAGLVQEINASDIRLTGKFMTLAQLADQGMAMESRETAVPGRVEVMPFWSLFVPTLG